MAPEYYIGIRFRSPLTGVVCIHLTCWLLQQSAKRMEYCTESKRYRQFGSTILFLSIDKSPSSKGMDKSKDWTRESAQSRFSWNVASQSVGFAIYWIQQNWGMDDKLVECTYRSRTNLHRLFCYENEQHLWVVWRPMYDCTLLEDVKPRALRIFKGLVPKSWF